MSKAQERLEQRERGRQERIAHGRKISVDAPGNVLLAEPAEEDPPDRLENMRNQLITDMLIDADAARAAGDHVGSAGIRDRLLRKTSLGVQRVDLGDPWKGLPPVPLPTLTDAQLDALADGRPAIEDHTEPAIPGLDDEDEES